MLRITPQSLNGHTPIRLKFEGKLLVPWIAEARTAVAAARQKSPRVVLDLSHLTFVDDAGAHLLHQFLRDGIQVVSCSPFVSELLHREKP